MTKTSKKIAGLLTLALFATKVFAADFKTQNNKIVHGIRSSTADKLIEIDTNDGANNPKLKVTNADKNWHATTNKLKVGDGTAGNKVFEADKGSGATNPKFQWNNSTTKWQFSNDGTTYKDFGSGSGNGSGGVNLLTSEDNNAFEDTTNQWTASGGSFTIESSAPLFGLGSAIFDASALNQTLSSNLKTIVEGLKDQHCLAAIAYKYAGSSGDYKLQVYDGSTVLSEISLEAATTTTDAFLGFGCPTSGSVRVRIIAAVSNPGAITFDGTSLAGGSVHLGSNILLAQITSSGNVGSLTYQSATNCEWTSTSSGWNSFPADTDCSTPTVTGQAVAPATKVPAVKFSTLPAGEYLLFVNGTFHDTSASQSAYGVFDGTTRSGHSYQSGSTGAFRSTIVARFSYASPQTDIQFDVQCYDPATGGCQLEADQPSLANQPLEFVLVKLDVEKKTVLQGIDTTGWIVDANIAGAQVDLGNSSVTAYQEATNSALSMTLATGSIGAQIPCSGTNPSTGLTCSAGDESVGVVFNLPKTGMVLACAEFPHQLTATSSSVYFQIVETPNNAQTILQEGKSRVGSGTAAQVYHPVHVCGTFYFSSIGQKTLRLMYEHNAAGTTSNVITADQLSTDGQRDIHWYVIPLNQNFPSPVILGKNITSSTDNQRIERAAIDTQCTSSPCTIDRSTAGISSVTRSGTGTYTINFAASTFSAPPVCTFTMINNQDCFRRPPSAPTSSNYPIDTRVCSTGALSDNAFEFMCMGTK